MLQNNKDTMVKLALSAEVHMEITAATREVSAEVSGICRIIECDDGFMAVENFIPKQRVTSATTELDPMDLAILESKHGDKDGGLWMWWHSHVDMPTSRSGQDKKQGAQFAEDCGRCMALIVNKRGEINGVYYHKIDTGVVGLPTVIEAPVDITIQMSNEEQRIADKISRHIKSNVSPMYPKSTRSAMHSAITNSDSSWTVNSTPTNKPEFDFEYWSDEYFDETGLEGNYQTIHRYYRNKVYDHSGCADTNNWGE